MTFGVDFASTTVVGVVESYEDVRGDVVRGYGSGTLVTLGDRHFVVTAGHTIEGRSVDEIFIAFPSRLALAWKTGEHVERVWCSKEPDVAVIELNEKAKRDWIGTMQMRPMPATAIGSSAEVEEGSEVWIVGYPTKMQSTALVESELARQQGEPGRVVEKVTRNGGILGRTKATWKVPNPHAADGATVLHARYDAGAYTENPETGAPHKIVDPHGASGGPVLRMVDRAFRLCAIVRSQHEHKPYLWCDDVTGAIALLREHEDAGVRADVERICDDDRVSADGQRSPGLTRRRTAPPEGR